MDEVSTILAILAGDGPDMALRREQAAGWAHWGEEVRAARHRRAELHAATAPSGGDR